MMSSHFDYIVYQKDGAFQVGKVFSVDADPSSAIVKKDLDQPVEKIDVFNENAFNDNDYMLPLRKVMCSISICDFCSRNVGVDHIQQEMTDMDNRLGYFYCNECRPRMTACLKYSGTDAIWYLRNRDSVWIPRTKRDENGKRIRHGPFVYEKWRIKGWHAHLMAEDEGWNLVPHVVCSNDELSKSVAVSTIAKCNPENNPEYNPNHDPKNESP
jgi:hypothetical protein